jgi:hypothetical protein
MLCSVNVICERPNKKFFINHSRLSLENKTLHCLFILFSDSRHQSIKKKISLLADIFQLDLMD